MSLNTRSRYLLNRIFIIGLLVLFLNDHVFKWEYSNWLTGKLSDFAGLLIFPFFLSFIFPKHIKHNVIGTGLFFLFWKTPFSQGFIDTYNSFAPITIWRVVDYSDYLALAILPFSYVQLKKIRFKSDLVLSQVRIMPIVFLIPVVLVFMSTSQIPTNFLTLSEGEWDLSPYSFKVRMSTETLLDEMRMAGIHVEQDDRFIRPDSLHKEYYDHRTFSKEDNPFYKVDELIVKNDTLRDIQFSLMPISKDKTEVFINGLGTVTGRSRDEIKNKHLRMYRRLLKRRLFRKLK